MPTAHKRGTEKIFDRPLAFTDLETTGVLPPDDEIVEIGCVLADPHTLQPISTFQRIVAIRNPLGKTEDQLNFNGYNAFTFSEWRDALPLEQALAEYALVVDDAVVWGYNVSFERTFLEYAFRATGVPNTLDYHFFDIMPLAYELLRGSGLEKFSLSSVANTLQLGDEPMPHRALNGAMLELRVYATLRALWAKH